MTSTLRILPWTTRPLGEMRSADYHGVLATLGYEPRSREVPLQLKDAVVKLAPAFVGQHVGSYETNRDELLVARFDVSSVEESAFSEVVRTVVGAVAEVADGALPRLAVDISSMSRWRIAMIVEELTQPEPGTALIVDLLYAPAVFEDPPATETPILSVEPVSPYLAGWWDDLDQPLAAIIGVGYELEHASSAIDRLEPEQTHVFVPHGDDPRFLQKVVRANQGLPEQTRDIQGPVPYTVTEPYQTFQAIETLVRRLRGSQRVAVVPLGPKIFAACAALVCSLHHPAAQLIRVTAHERREPLNSLADGSICGLRLVVGAVDDAALYQAEQAVQSRPHVQPDHPGFPSPATFPS